MQEYSLGPSSDLKGDLTGAGTTEDVFSPTSASIDRCPSTLDSF